MARKPEIYFYKDADWLNQVLKLNGLSKESFANTIGFSSRQVSNWLNSGGITYNVYMIITTYFPDLREDDYNPGNNDFLSNQYKQLMSKKLELESEIIGIKKQLYEFERKFGHRISEEIRNYFQDVTQSDQTE